jgi:hypothetical protein
MITLKGRHFDMLGDPGRIAGAQLSECIKKNSRRNGHSACVEVAYFEGDGSQ